MALKLNTHVWCNRKLVQHQSGSITPAIIVVLPSKDDTEPTICFFPFHEVDLNALTRPACQDAMSHVMPENEVKRVMEAGGLEHSMFQLVLFGLDVYAFMFVLDERVTTLETVCNTDLGWVRLDPEDQEYSTVLQVFITDDNAYYGHKFEKFVCPNWRWSQNTRNLWSNPGVSEPVGNEQNLFDTAWPIELAGAANEEITHTVTPAEKKRATSPPTESASYSPSDDVFATPKGTLSSEKIAASANRALQRRQAKQQSSFKSQTWPESAEGLERMGHWGLNEMSMTMILAHMDSPIVLLRTDEFTTHKEMARLLEHLHKRGAHTLVLPQAGTVPNAGLPAFEKDPLAELSAEQIQAVKPTVRIQAIDTSTLENTIVANGFPPDRHIDTREMLYTLLRSLPSLAAWLADPREASEVPQLIWKAALKWNEDGDSNLGRMLLSEDASEDSFYALRVPGEVTQLFSQCLLRQWLREQATAVAKTLSSKFRDPQDTRPLEEAGRGLRRAARAAWRRLRGVRGDLRDTGDWLAGLGVSAGGSLMRGSVVGAAFMHEIAFRPDAYDDPVGNALYEITFTDEKGRSVFEQALEKATSKEFVNIEQRALEALAKRARDRKNMVRSREWVGVRALLGELGQLNKYVRAVQELVFRIQLPNAPKGPRVLLVSTERDFQALRSLMKYVCVDVGNDTQCDPFANPCYLDEVMDTRAVRDVMRGLLGV